MKKFLNFLLVVSMITGLQAGYCLADEVTQRDDSIRFESDAPIVNCKTAEQDIAAYQKTIADMHTKLLKEEEGLVPPSDYDGDGIMDPEKDIEAAQAQQQDLDKKIANIKGSCGLN